MRGKRKIWILLGVLAVLFLANWLLGSWNHKQEELEAEESEADKVYLTEEADITSFSYSDGENEMAFCKVDDQWCYEEDSEIPMNQDSVQAIADNITGMSAERLLEDPDDLADYGLDAPQYTINYVDEDGQTLTIYIGNAAGENYYATVGDTGEVYTVSGDFKNWLVFDLAELVQYDTVPVIGSGNLKKVTVCQAGDQIVYEEEEDLAQLAGGFGTLSLTDCVDYHVSDEKLAEYGLDEEHRMTVEAEYTDNDSGEEQSFLFYVGELDESGEYRYVMVEGSRIVYRVSDAIVQNMMTTEE